MYEKRTDVNVKERAQDEGNVNTCVMCDVPCEGMTCGSRACARGYACDNEREE